MPPTGHLPMEIVRSQVRMWLQMKRTSATAIKSVSLKNGACAQEPQGQGSDHSGHGPSPIPFPCGTGAGFLKPGMQTMREKVQYWCPHLPPPQSGAGQCRSKGHPTSSV